MRLINGLRSIIICIAILLLSINCFGESTLSENNGIISDFEARRALANILSYNDKTLDEAVKEYFILIKERPDEVELRLELAQIRARQKKYQNALDDLDAVLTRFPDRYETIIEKALIEARMGHIKKGKELFMSSFERVENSDKLVLKFADFLNMSGAFDKAEKRYRDYLQENPNDFEVRLFLASTLTAEQRYEEAEEIYLKLLLNNWNIGKIFVKLAKLKLHEKDFKEALRYVDKTLAMKPMDIGLLSLKAKVLYFSNKYDDALDIYCDIENRDIIDETTFISIGKTYLKLNKLQLAKKYFEKAYQYNHENIEAQFYKAWPSTVVSDMFIKDTLGKYRNSPVELEEWAQLYKMSGFMEIAIKFYEEVLDFDAFYFPAKISLAETLAIVQEYDRSINVLDELKNDYPDNYKVLVLHARVLSWAKQYDKSFHAYDKSIKLNPFNSRLQREKARVAIWDKNIKLAMSTYTQIKPVPVDIKLFNKLKDLHGAEEFLTNNLSELKREIENNSIYQGYEEFKLSFKEQKDQLSDEVANKIELIIVNLHSHFSIQKAIELESQAKKLTWDRNFITAMSIYEELIKLEPGNQEAIFDYAQIKCATGLCDEAIETYIKLLNIDPLHNRSIIALEREEHKQNISLGINRLYWKEKGRGELSDIIRYRTDLEVNIPVQGRNKLNFTEHFWLEDPGLSSDSFSANGFSIGFDWILNEFISGSAKATYKNYSDSEMQDEITEHSNFQFNVWDYAKIGIGYDRATEIYNFFGIDDGVTSDSGWLSVSSDILHNLEIKSRASYQSFSDNNERLSFSLSAGYSFTEYPKIFKVILSGDYFDAQKLNIFQFEENELVDIVHPYWTPEDYKTGELTFKWYHNLSKMQFCGSEQHFYDIRISPGMNSESTFSLKIETGWHYEFLDHWKAGLEASLFRSTEWDSESLWASVEFQF